MIRVFVTLFLLGIALYVVLQVVAVIAIGVSFALNGVRVVKSHVKRTAVTRWPAAEDERHAAHLLGQVRGYAAHRSLALPEDRLAGRPVRCFRVDVTRPIDWAALQAAVASGTACRVTVDGPVGWTLKNPFTPARCEELRLNQARPDWPSIEAEFDYLRAYYPSPLRPGRRTESEELVFDPPFPPIAPAAPPRPSHKPEGPKYWIRSSPDLDGVWEVLGPDGKVVESTHDEVFAQAVLSWWLSRT